MNFDRSSRVLRFRSNSKLFGSNKLQRSQGKEQNQNSKIPERQHNFDSYSSKLADQNGQPSAHWKFDIRHSTFVIGFLPLRVLRVADRRFAVARDRIRKRGQRSEVRAFDLCALAPLRETFWQRSGTFNATLSDNSTRSFVAHSR